ncbi:MAG: M20/M25/M40 family metallo-hydrolase, partial [bacterium]|nr:M20/M25/M40 family metallo-hydrolase [bacterium]
MKKIIFLVLVVFCVSLVADESLLITHLQQNVDAGDIFEIVETLASPEYEGRLTGSDGYDKAVELAAAHFKKYGVQPVFADGSYIQSFPLPYTKVYESKLTLHFNNEEGKQETVNCEYFKDFYPLSFSGSGEKKEDVVFAGYGITAHEFNYDDYRGIDVKGKIVMIIKGAPKAKEGENWLPYNDHRHRTKNARDHGAAGFIYIYAARGNPNGIYLENFPMVSIEEKLADRMFKQYGKEIKSLRKKLNERRNVSFKTGIKAELMVKSEHFKSSARNAVGYIPGSDKTLADEFVVIGAHLDHCGMWPQLTPGADDNASGSAVVLTIAKTLATCSFKPKRSILFILFAGEEMGLLGSTYFASHLPEKVKKVKFVFNMDMVGSGPNVFILRLKNYPKMEKIITAAPQILNLNCKITGNKVTGSRRGGSDHAPFVQKGIPAVSIFSAGGKHHGYHKNSDTIYWITPKIMEDIAKIVSYTAVQLADK